ncbi:hypothetical protein E2C01_074256 [Portunus trituberculatus]|uniref:Uncharacterized protein n=1 Tax=Portunus trituberculatus TaxID=210409 RepID=A0A5B7IGM0_PORTR|nr:hypothetical protein [Portunus trituberculatus]
MFLARQVERSEGAGGVGGGDGGGSVVTVAAISLDHCGPAISATRTPPNAGTLVVESATRVSRESWQPGATTSEGRGAQASVSKPPGRPDAGPTPCSSGQHRLCHHPRTPPVPPPPPVCPRPGTSAPRRSAKRYAADSAASAPQGGQRPLMPRARRSPAPPTSPSLARPRIRNVTPPPLPHLQEARPPTGPCVARPRALSELTPSPERHRLRQHKTSWSLTFLPPAGGVAEATPPVNRRLNTLSCAHLGPDR